MTKFSNREDQGYDAILGELQRWKKSATQKRASKVSKPTEGVSQGWDRFGGTHTWNSQMGQDRNISQSSLCLHVDQVSDGVCTARHQRSDFVRVYRSVPVQRLPASRSAPIHVIIESVKLVSDILYHLKSHSLVAFQV